MLLPGMQQEILGAGTLTMPSASIPLPLPFTSKIL